MLGYKYDMVVLMEGVRFVVGDDRPDTRSIDVCALDELADGEVKLVVRDGHQLALARVGDDVRAFANACPHRAGPLGRGRIACQLDADGVGTPTIRDGRWVLLCPWHAWEFSLDDGRSVIDPAYRARVYDTEVRDGRVRVVLGRRSDRPTRSTAERREMP